MTESGFSDRRRWIGGGLLLLLAAGLLFGTGTFGPIAEGPDAGPDTRFENADMLDAGATDTADSHGELVGDMEAAERRARRGRGPVTVTVTGPNDVPLQKVFVILAEKTSVKAPVPLREALTDAVGRARFEDAPYDGTARVLIGTRSTPIENDSFSIVGGVSELDLFLLPRSTGLDTQGSAYVRGPAVALRCSAGLPLDLQFVDAATGRRVRAAKGRIWPQFAGLEGKPAPAGAPTAVARGMRCQYRIAVDVPTGYVPYPEDIRVRRPIHPDVTRATHVVALHREAEIVLVAKHGSRLPSLEGSTLHVGSLNVYRQSEYTAPDAFGRVRVRDFPFVPHMLVDVHWGFASGGYAAGQGRFGGTHAEGLVIELDVVHPSDTTDADEEIEDSVETDNDLEHEESFGEGESAPTPSRVVLHVTRPDGTPATFAVAELGGVKTMFRPVDRGVRDWSIVPGRHAVLVWGAGADLRRTVEVGPGPRQDIRLQGTEGGRLRVSIRDTEGRALPHARVSIVGPTQWAQSDVKDGHQRLDSLTDASGERMFHRVAVGRCRVHIRYGGFHYAKSVEIRAGRTTKLDYVMDLSR